MSRQEVHALYDGEVRLVYDDPKHSYFVGEVKIPSVTTVTGEWGKRGLMYWAAKKAGEYIEATMEPGKPYDEVGISELAKGAQMAHRNFTDKAAMLGSKVHSWIEGYVRSKLGDAPRPRMPKNAEMLRGVTAFLDWVKENEVEFLFTERKIFSRKHEYAGTVDIGARVGGQLTVADAKTGSGVYDEHYLQLAAYRSALAEELPEWRNGAARAILHVPITTGELKVYDLADRNPSDDQEAFLGLRRAFRVMKGW